MESDGRETVDTKHKREEEERSGQQEARSCSTLLLLTAGLLLLALLLLLLIQLLLPGLPARGLHCLFQVRGTSPHLHVRGTATSLTCGGHYNLTHVRGALHPKGSSPQKMQL